MLAIGRLLAAGASAAVLTVAGIAWAEPAAAPAAHRSAPAPASAPALAPEPPVVATEAPTSAWAPPVAPTAAPAHRAATTTAPQLAVPRPAASAPTAPHPAPPAPVTHPAPPTPAARPAPTPALPPQAKTGDTPRMCIDAVDCPDPANCAAAGMDYDDVAVVCVARQKSDEVTGRQVDCPDGSIGWQNADGTVACGAEAPVRP